MVKRKPEIAVLNVLFCLLVVFIHILSEQIAGLNKSAPAYYLIYVPWRLAAFVMQGFVVLSGVKFFIKFGKDDFDYLSFIKNRFLKIYVPYVIWVVAYYLYFCYLKFYMFSFSELLNFIWVGNVVSPFYFIIVIMQFYLLMPLWIMLIKKTDACLLIPASVFIMLIMKGMNINYNDRIFTTYLAYWIIGCCVGANYEKLKELLNRNKVFIAVVCAAAMISDAVLSSVNIAGKGSFSFLETLHVFYCVAIILFLFGISGKLKNPILFNIVKKLDSLSFGIFLSHCFFIYMVNDIMAQYEVNRAFNRLAIRAVFVYCFSVVLCMAYGFLKRKLIKR